MPETDSLKGEAERQILKVAISGSSVVAKSGKENEPLEESDS